MLVLCLGVLYWGFGVQKVVSSICFDELMYVSETKRENCRSCVLVYSHGDLIRTFFLSSAVMNQ